MQRIAWKKWLGYGFFTWCVFVWCVYLTFPADLVADKLIASMKTSTEGVWNITYQEASMCRFSGVCLDGVTLFKGTASMPLKHMRVRALLLPLFSLRVGALVHMETEDGSLDVQVVSDIKGTSPDVEIESDAFPLNTPLFAFAEGIPLDGFLTGEGHVQWAPIAANSTGEGNFKIEKLAVGPGALNGFSFPKLDFGVVETGLVMKESVLKTKGFKQTEGDVALKMQLDITVRPHTEMSPVEMCVHVKPSTAFLAKNIKCKQ